MKTRLLVIGLVALMVAADDKAKDDKEKLQGTWLVQKAERGGQEIEQAKDLNITITFTGDKMTIKLPDREIEGTIKLDATKKPKIMDVTGKTDGGDQTRLGIYELDGDMLKMCRAAPGEERPTEFKSKEGTEQTFIICKREKK